MPTDTLVDVLRREVDGFPNDVDAQAIDRVLTEPQQNALAEAIAADAIDAVPLAGDVLFLTRQEKANTVGMEYPERPTALENALSDLPPPLDTIGDILISQNVLHYLQRNYNLDVTNVPDDVTGDLAMNMDQFIDTILPTRSPQ